MQNPINPLQGGSVLNPELRHSLTLKEKDIRPEEFATIEAKFKDLERKIFKTGKNYKETLKKKESE